MITYTHPRSLPRSAEFKLRINGRSIETLHTGVADFAICALEPEDFPATVEVMPSLPPASASVHPVSKGIHATVCDGRVCFTLERPEKVAVNIPGYKAFYLFANPPENNPPALDAPGIVTFAPGQIHEVPMLTLEEGNTLYLPGGTVLKGRIHIKGRAGIRICGHGIFDGSFYDAAKGDTIPSIILECCPGVLVEDITMVRPQSWMIVLAACRGATVRNVKQIGEVGSSDGIDIVGSRDVQVEDCFLHNNDDCVVIKALFLGSRNVSGTEIDARENVENVLIRHCTFANWTAGNAMEIGHELSVEQITNITFRDIDVLHCHGQGAVFSLHNNDRAVVSNILFENIRIEHCYDKLIDFRISRSRYSSDIEHGHIRNITLRDIHWTRTPFNAGYTTSLIGGWDKDHRVTNVLIEKFFIDGAPVCNLDQLEICTRHCDDLHLQS